jgi:hypothetical protein
MVDLMDYVGGDPTNADPSPAAVGYSTSTFSNMKRGRPAVMAVGRFHGHEGEHAGMRTIDEMTVTALVCAAYNCAVQLFDVCNADGTLYRSPYTAFKAVFDRIRPIEPFLGGEKIRHVAIYASEDTKDFLYESRSTQETDEYVSGLRETFRAFQEHHIPVDVITNLNLDQLGEYALVCLPDQICLRGDEVDALSTYVQRGGKLLATRFTSLADPDGNHFPNFALADVFGVDYLGPSENPETYVAIPLDLCREAGITDDIEVKFDTQAMVWARPDAEVLARLVLPYTNRLNDSDRWVGCWGNPPGIKTDYPSIVFNQYELGTACYIAGRLTTLNRDVPVEEPRALVYALGRRLLGDDVPLTIQAPPWVIATGFRQPAAGRIVVHLVNSQRELPIMPVRDIAVTLRPQHGEIATAVSTVPDGETLAFRQEEDVITFTIPEVHLYQGAAVTLK